MTAQEALLYGARLLKEISDEANLEAELLLGHAQGVAQVHLYQRLQEPLTPDVEAHYRQYLERRLHHEPTAYILGRKEFFGLELEVTPAALIPRPETELLVEPALAHLGRREPQTDLSARAEALVIDVGVGCGAIACALAAHLPPTLRILGIDISAEALALAEHNLQRLGLQGRITLRQGDLLSGQEEAADLIGANLPYVRSRDWEAGPPGLRFEPRIALDGGADGLRLIERLLREAPPLLKPGGALLAEIGEEQGRRAQELARECFPQAQISVYQDLAGLDRVLEIKT